MKQKLTPLRSLFRHRSEAILLLINCLNVSLWFLAYPASGGMSLSGRNWEFGFPFDWFHFRNNFVGQTFGGVLDLQLVPLLLDLACGCVMCLGCRYCLKNRTESRRSVYYLSGLLFLLAALLDTRTQGSFDSLLAYDRNICIVMADLVLGSLIVCAIRSWSILSKP